MSESDDFQHRMQSDRNWWENFQLLGGIIAAAFALLAIFLAFLGPDRSVVACSAVAIIGIVMTIIGIHSVRRIDRITGRRR